MVLSVWRCETCTNPNTQDNVSGRLPELFEKALEAIKDLDKKKQASHQRIGGTSPISHMQLCARLENPEHLSRCSQLVFPR